MRDVRFVAYQRTLPTEQLLLVGSGVGLGDWEPGRAVPLVKNRDGFTNSVVAPVDDRCETVEYKYLLVDQNIPGHVKWENGSNRAVQVLAEESQTKDYSFENGDGGWIPYEEPLEFLIVEDSEEDSDEDESSTTTKKADGDREENFLTMMMGVGRGTPPRKESTGRIHNFSSSGVDRKVEQTDVKDGSRNVNSMRKPASAELDKPNKFWSFWGGDDPKNDMLKSKPAVLHSPRPHHHHSHEGNGFCQEGSKVPLMNVSGNHRVIARRASDVNLQDGQPLYRTKALPLWLLWRQENNHDLGSNASKSPKPTSPVKEPRSKHKEGEINKSELDAESDRKSSKSGNVPFWMLM